MIWDFQVFSQIWIIRNYRPEPDYFADEHLLLRDLVQRQSNYGLGSAIALVMVLVMLDVTFFYIRQMVRIGEIDEQRRRTRSAPTAQPPQGRAARRPQPDGPARLRRDGLPGLLDGLDRVQARQRRALVHAEVDPAHPTLVNFRDAIDRPYFWDDVKNSLIVVCAVVAAVGRARVPRAARAREVPLPRQRASSS